MRPILNVVGISKRMELADYNYRPPPGGPPGGGAGLCARRFDVCIKSGIAPEPRVVGGGLETGCSGYQERVAQNPASGWWEPPRGPERPPRAGGPEPPLSILLVVTQSQFL